MNTWQLLEPFGESIQADGLSGYVSGLTARHPDGKEIWGSGFAENADEAQERARAELAERIAILENSQALPPNPDYALARSNGWAAHTERSSAQHRAFLELNERHQVLYSWYTGIAPTKMGQEFPLDTVLPVAWAELKPRLELYRFASSGETTTVMAVLRPPQHGTPAFNVCGFACDDTLDRAAYRATNEAAQRWAFLRDQQPETDITAMTPSALFQQEFGISPEGQALFDRWLANELPGLSPNYLPYLYERNSQFTFYTQSLSDQGYQICRCEQKDAIPLVFGRRPRTYLEWIPSDESRWIHPVA